MGRRPSYAPLQVCLNGQSVARLRKQASGAIDFTYDQTWLDNPQAVGISSSLPLREQIYRGAEVSAFFENLLPDNLDIRRQVASKVAAESADTYDLLTAIGRDCVGALQFLPIGSATNIPPTLTGRAVDEAEIAGILRSLATSPLGVGPDPEFRISIAGAHEKTALLKRDGQWMLPSGMTPTTHIFKPAIGILENGMDLSLSVENEFLCLRLARQFGLRTAHAELARFEDKTVLVVERFDRSWTADRSALLRIPQEDLCQALGYPSNRKYEADKGPGIDAIMRHLLTSDDPEADRRQFLTAQFFFWLLGATDGHAKNFSQFLFVGGRFRMTPLYDILSAQPVFDDPKWQRKHYRLAMAVGNDRHYGVDELAWRHFAQSAAKSGYSATDASAAFSRVADTARDNIDCVLNDLPAGFPDRLATSITQGILSRLHRAAISD